MVDRFHKNLSAIEMQRLETERQEKAALLHIPSDSDNSSSGTHKHKKSKKHNHKKSRNDGSGVGEENERGSSSGADLGLTEHEAKILIQQRHEEETKTAGEKVKAHMSEAWRRSETYRTLAAHCWDRPRMTLADTMLLSPWQKWKKYNRVPWKVVLHALIFLVVTIQVLLAYVETSQYTRATHNTFESLFLVQGSDPDVTSVTMHTMEEVLESLKHTVDTYYEINSKAIDMYMQRHSDRDTLGDVRPIQLYYSAYNRNFFVLENDTWDIQADDLHQTDVHYNLTKDDPYGPFNTTEPENLQDAFQRLVKMSVSFNFINLNVGVLGPIPFMWDVMLLYTKEGGEIKLELLLDKQIYYTTSIGLETQNIFTIFNVIVFVLTFVSFIFAVRAFFTNVVTFLKTKRTYLAIPKKVMKQENYPAWSRIPFAVKFEFFPLWNIHIMLTSVFLMVASVLGLVEEFGYKTGMAYSIFEGMGALGASVTILRYLEYYEHFYTLILTLRISGLRIARFIISAFPIFFGYMLMGVVLFAPYSIRFEDLNNTAITLFALLNGDDIRASFEQLNENYPYPIVPTIYLYSFIALFITAILNIFIFIIEDSYHAAKISKRTQGKANGAGAGAVGGSHGHAHGGGGGGHAHGGIGGFGGGHLDGETRARLLLDKNGNQFDIFALFRILDREYNVNDDDDDDSDEYDDDDEMDVLVDRDEGQKRREKKTKTKEMKEMKEKEGRGQEKERKEKKAGKHKHAAADEEKEPEVGSGPAPSGFSINAVEGDEQDMGMASLLRQSLGVAARTMLRASTLDGGSRTPSRDYREPGRGSYGESPRGFNFRITYKKLKRDLNEIMADQMGQLEEELRGQVAELQAKHTARLQKRIKAQLQKSLEHLLPHGGAATAESWRPGAFEYRESPF